MKRLILFFIFIICSFSVTAQLYTYSCDSKNVSDDFQYADSFTFHNWSLNSIAYGNNSPILSTEGSLSWGIRTFNAGAGSGSTYIEKTGRKDNDETYNMDNYTSGNMIISFDEITEIVVDATHFPWVMTLYNTNINDRFFLRRISENYIETIAPNLDGFETCTIYAPYQQKNTILMDLDLTGLTYDIYLNGAIRCDDKVLETSSFNNTQTQIALSLKGLSNMETYIDNFVMCDGDVVEDTGRTECEYPKVFCDDFDDDLPLADKWTVFNYDNSLNTTAVEQGGFFIWNYSEPKSIGYNEIEPFDSDFATSSTSTVTKSIQAPVMTTEFDINLKEGLEFNDTFAYTTYDYDGQGCVYLMFENVSGDLTLEFLNESADIGTAGTFNYNANHTIKVEHVFGDANKSYPFNTTADTNYFNLFFDGNNIVSAMPFNDRCKSVYSAYFTRYSRNNVTLDNYYEYVGVDKDTEILTPFYTPIYTPTDNETDEGATSDDMAVVIDDFWGSFGLKSTRSKFMFGLMLMFIVAVLTVGIMISAHHISVGVVAMVEFMFMILLVFMGLVPVWTVILITVLGAGIGFFAVKNNMGG